MALKEKEATINKDSDRKATMCADFVTHFRRIKKVLSNIFLLLMQTLSGG